LTNCNLLALKFCSVNLAKDLLKNKEDYDQFIISFNSVV
jgi:hypothetical protein